MKKWFAALILIALLSMIVPACSSSTPTATTPAATTPTATTAKPTTTTPTTSPSPTALVPQAGGSFKWIRNSGIPSIGTPLDYPSLANGTIMFPVLEPLLTCDANENIQPYLAQSWDIAQDGKSVTFHLRTGIKFQDGTDFNADAVKFVLQSDLTKNVNGSAVLKKITSYDVLDAATLRLNLTSFDATLLLNLAQGAISLMYSPAAQSKPTPEEHLVGTGPYKFDSWQRDTFIKCVKWSGYWQNGKPYIDTQEYRNNADQTAAVMSFRAGEVNMVENVDYKTSLDLTKSGYSVSLIPETFLHTIWPDSANPDSPFAKLQVRQALEYAIDKASMAKGIWGDYAKDPYEMAGPNDPWFVSGLTARKYDVAKAKQLLTDAGYPNGFTYPLISDVRINKDQLTGIQTYLDAVGIHTTLDMADVARFTTLITNGWKGILVPGFPYWSSFNRMMILYTDPTLSYPGMAKPAGWAANWQAVITETDFTKRMALMKPMIQTIADQALIIPYLYNSPIYATDGTVMDMNWGGNHTNGWFDPANMWLKKK